MLTRVTNSGSRFSAFIVLNYLDIERMHILDLPEETLLSIVELVRAGDHVEHGDFIVASSDVPCTHKALKSLSLVCSRFWPIAQREHFSHITIQGPSNIEATPPCNLFLDLITRQPIIASYVRGLILVNKGDRFGDVVTSWITPNATSVASLLARLPSLVGFHLLSSKPVWNQLPIQIPEEVLASMYSLIRQPSLAILWFTGFSDIPIDLLDHCPQLQELHLKGSTFNHPCLKNKFRLPSLGEPRDNIPSIALSPTMPQLRLLEIRESFPVAMSPYIWRYPPLACCIRKLESLRISCFFSGLTNVSLSDFRCLKRLHISCGAHLDGYRSDVVLRGRFRAAPPSRPVIPLEEKFINLSAHPFLQSLEIGIMLTFSPADRSKILWLANTLRSLPIPNRSIRQIDVRLRIHKFDGGTCDGFDFTMFKPLSLAFLRLHEPDERQRRVLEYVGVEIVPNVHVEWDAEQLRSEIAWLGCGSDLSFRLAIPSKPAEAT